MKKIIDWVQSTVAPIVEKMGQNVWLQATQEAILACVPATLVGSIASLFGYISSLGVSWLPDLSNLSSFSFGLFGLMLSYIVPCIIMEKKRHRAISRQAGLTGIGLFLLLIFPSYDEAGNLVLNSMNLGVGGMLNALISGYLVAFVYNVFANHPIIKEDSSLPSFISNWFNTLVPWTLCLLFGVIFTFALQIDLIEAIRSLLMPLTKLASSFWGYIIIDILVLFMYSFGISAWVIFPIMSLIWNECFAMNLELVAQGLTAKYINISEVFYMATIGGQGSTLALCIFMAILAKSKRLKTIGRAAILPSLFDINEPVVYGAPVAFNPILMVPFWIAGLTNAIIVWIGFAIGFAPIPIEPFQLAVPNFVTALMATKSVNGLILHFIAFAATALIYYPFFKVYDKKCCEEEAAEGKKASV